MFIAASFICQYVYQTDITSSRINYNKTIAHNSHQLAMPVNKQSPSQLTITNQQNVTISFLQPHSLAVL